jgi:lysophospholipase L1-like esterase
MKVLLPCAVLTAALLAGGLACDQAAPLVLLDQRQSPVILVDTAGLEPPAIGHRRDVFRPLNVSAVVAANPDGEQAAGFFLTVAVHDPGALRMRLADLESGAGAALHRIAPPADDAARNAAATPAAFSAEGRERLLGGAGVFWETGETDGLNARFGVLLPETRLSAFTRLDLFASTTEDGIALGAAHIELVRDFLYFAILGDSVLWGNGLLEQDKMSTLVAGVIERETGRKVIRQRFAQSGADIVPEGSDGVCGVDCFGETPTVETSITKQVELIERPELVDLVLMDGCINDVGVTTIINPATGEQELEELTQQFCEDAMRDLLLLVRATVPQATIIVTGYYPLVGPESDIFALRQWSQTQGFAPDTGDEALIRELVDQSLLFVDVAHRSLQQAIDAASAAAPASVPMAFVDPQFGVERAVFTPDRWLWSMTTDNALFVDLELDFALFPEDSMQQVRLDACFDQDTIDSSINCLYASVGHPNPAGARAYADQILAQLRAVGVLPAGSQ